MAYIVTGGHSPIALAISRDLSLHSRVFHLTRKVDSLLVDETRESKNIILEEWDLTNISECTTKLKSKMKSEIIDGIVFAHRYRGLEQDSLSQFIVEVQAPHQMVKLYSSHGEKTGGSVVFLTSPAAYCVVPDQDFAYHASKAAIAQLVKFAAIKYTAKGHRFNGVSTGAFISKERSRKYYESNPDKLSAINEFLPLKRMGGVSEVASVVSFLCSEKSSYINGEIIKVDGGYTNMEPSSLLSS